MAQTFDVIVVGAGMAGASVATSLAPTRRVVVLEGEGQAGYHSTGRSAALYSAIYGGPAIRALSRASWPFFVAPPTNIMGEGLCLADIAPSPSRRAWLASAAPVQMDVEAVE